jgi:hypothetical protein
MPFVFSQNLYLEVPEMSAHIIGKAAQLHGHYFPHPPASLSSVPN